MCKKQHTHKHQRTHIRPMDAVISLSSAGSSTCQIDPCLAASRSALDILRAARYLGKGEPEGMGVRGEGECEEEGGGVEDVRVSARWREGEWKRETESEGRSSGGAGERVSSRGR